MFGEAALMTLQRCPAVHRVYCLPFLDLSRPNMLSLMHPAYALYRAGGEVLQRPMPGKSLIESDVHSSNGHTHFANLLPGYWQRTSQIPARLPSLGNIEGLIIVK